MAILFFVSSTSFAATVYFNTVYKLQGTSFATSTSSVVLGASTLTGTNMSFTDGLVGTVFPNGNDVGGPLNIMMQTAFCNPSAE